MTPNVPLITYKHPIRLLEELSLNAWPSLQSVYDDGWMLRFSQGYTRRANSVNPLYPPSEKLDEKIRRSESWYRARKQDIVFKMTPLALPKELDGVLARQGYKEEAVTSVQTVSLDTLDTPHQETITLTPDLNDDWLTLFCQMRGLNLRLLATMRNIINSIVPARTFAVLYREGAPAAMGFAVAEKGYVGLYDITTAENMRNRGIGRQLVLYLLNWGKANGATNAYLQVMITNAPALHLYETLGFQEVYQYWYRVKP
jgi:N-acetylglutamate synthase